MHKVRERLGCGEERERQEEQREDLRIPDIHSFIEHWNIDRGRTCPNCQIGPPAGAKWFLATVSSVKVIQITSKMDTMTPQR